MPSRMALFGLYFYARRTQVANSFGLRGIKLWKIASPVGTWIGVIQTCQTNHIKYSDMSVILVEMRRLSSAGGVH